MKSFLPLILLLALPLAILAQNTLVVKSDSSNAAINSCLKKNATASSILSSNLNKAISGGKFTFYGAGGTGACGLSAGKPSMSAAASGSLFKSNGQFVAPCTGSQWVLSDAVCINKCVKISYKCVGCSATKTLTVPITNRCSECPINHVDLSEPAFKWLEPKGGEVGIGKDATITYIDC